MSDLLNLEIQSAETEWLSLWKRGPSRLRWVEVPLQTGDIAPDFELPDSTGHAASACAISGPKDPCC